MVIKACQYKEEPKAKILDKCGDLIPGTNLDLWGLSFEEPDSSTDGQVFVASREQTP